MTSLVKRWGHCLFPASFEHRSPDHAMMEAKRLAAQNPGAVFFVYAPVAVVVRPVYNGRTVTFKTDREGRVLIGDVYDRMKYESTFRTKIRS